jgi:uncharacterized membrane protein YjgN (DUF898 family)
MAHGKFEFVGKGGSYFWLCVWTAVLTFLTLGIFFPWAYCARQKWTILHTVIDGNQLTFRGTGGGFFGTWLLIVILSLITFGLYIPWGYCRFQRWVTNNTYFADPGDNEHTN